MPGLSFLGIPLLSGCITTLISVSRFDFLLSPVVLLMNISGVSPLFLENSLLHRMLLHVTQIPPWDTSSIRTILPYTVWSGPTPWSFALFPFGPSRHRIFQSFSMSLPGGDTLVFSSGSRDLSARLLVQCPLSWLSDLSYSSQYPFRTPWLSLPLTKATSPFWFLRKRVGGGACPQAPYWGGYSFDSVHISCFHSSSLDTF